MVSQDFIDKFFLKFDHEIHFIISMKYIHQIKVHRIRSRDWYKTNTEEIENTEAISTAL